ncbi:MAG: hypothetical protein A3J24_06870 [Deltaproteobacteria bacterium RIFCSPLOWO2_02_FULL_53_8]|nr:MAG: hypothetical protein A3J24_06870 [Deltaproteobacteria bacterium RIFCSPLOWO2_02_FULL_53_8]
MIITFYSRISLKKYLPSLFFLSILLLLLASSCVMVGKGVMHTVGKGETLYRIAHTYKADPQDLAEINNINDPKELKAGFKLFIPGASKVLKVRPLPQGDDIKRYAAKQDVNYAIEPDHEDKIVMDKKRFAWPVKGVVESPFGMRSGTKHDGIDIKAPEGTPIKAADSGKAVYSSTMRGYGNMIILKHKGDFYTVYAHNKKNIVNDGDTVAAGDVIATVGDTGNAKGAHLHFEVRQGKKVRNPLFFLP